MYKKYFLIILFLFHGISVACEVRVIAFKGLNSSFDYNSFNDYVRKMKGCSKVFEWNQTENAIKFINKDHKPFHLYGFSKGAESVSIIMRQINRQPVYIITVGAWHTVDLDFSPYGVNFHNYFDDSGSKQKSPGLRINNVPHMMMQDHVNQYYK